jgi:hypothetical protein
MGGTIGSLNRANSTFVLQRNGISTTIMVTSATRYTGSATSFAQLRTGWQAHVHGNRSAGVVIASAVDADPEVGP